MRVFKSTFLVFELENVLLHVGQVLVELGVELHDLVVGGSGDARVVVLRVRRRLGRICLRVACQIRHFLSRSLAHDYFVEQHFLFLSLLEICFLILLGRASSFLLLLYFYPSYFVVIHPFIQQLIPFRRYIYSNCYIIISISIFSHSRDDNCCCSRRCCCCCPAGPAHFYLVFYFISLFFVRHSSQCSFSLSLSRFFLLTTNGN